MLIFQFTVATFFIGSYIVYQQIDYLTNKDLGFKGDQVIEINLNFPNSDYEGKT
jgi:putative ABC transport system permease protein